MGSRLARSWKRTSPIIIDDWISVGTIRERIEILDEEWVFQKQIRLSRSATEYVIPGIVDKRKIEEYFFISILVIHSWIQTKEMKYVLAFLQKIKFT